MPVAAGWAAAASGPGLVPSRGAGDSRGRAARDAGALWDANP